LIFVQRVALHGYHKGLHLLHHVRVHDHVHHDRVPRDHGRDCVSYGHECAFHAHADFHFDARAKPSSHDCVTILINSVVKVDVNVFVINATIHWLIRLIINTIPVFVKNYQTFRFH
jgi:hypothetical protein